MPKSISDWVNAKLAKIFKPATRVRISKIEIPHRPHFRPVMVKMTARRVAEAVLERRLRNTEHVHHIDWNHNNDSLDNLTLLSPKEHRNVHVGHARRFITLSDLVMQRVALEIAR